MKAIKLLNLRRLRRQPLRTVIAALSVATGVALAGAVFVVTTSFNASVEEFGRSLSGPAPLRVVGPASRGGLDEAVLGRVERVPGVLAAVPAVQAVTLADPPSRRDIGILAIGFDCRLEALVGRLGCAPQAIASAGTGSLPLISEHLARALGPHGVIRTDLGSRPVNGAIAIKALDKMNNGNVVAYPLPAAQALFARPHRLDVIYVLPARGVRVATLRDRVAQAVGPNNSVLKRTDVRPDYAVFLVGILPSLALISLFALAVAAVLVHNTLTLSFEERRRDLAVVSALGAKRRTLIGGAVAEAAAFGVMGGIAGTGGAFVIARPILGGFSWFARQVGGFTLRVHLALAPLVLCVVLGALTAVAAAIGPALRASRVDVVAELGNRERGAARARALARTVLITVVGLIAFVAVWWVGRGNGLGPSDPLVGEVGYVVASVALVWGAGGFAPYLFGAASRLRRHPGAAARLGWANLVRDPRRASVLLIATSLLVGIGVAISGITAMIGRAIGEFDVKSMSRDVLVVTQPENNDINLDARPAPWIEGALRRVPGVAAVHKSVFIGIGAVGKDIVAVRGVDDDALPYPMLIGRKDTAAFERGGVYVGPVLARQRRLRPGSTFRLPGLKGIVELHVIGVWADGNSAGTEVYAPMWLAEKIYGPQSPNAYSVTPAAGVDGRVLARRIEAAHLDPFLRALDTKQLSHSAAAQVVSFAAPFWALQRGMMVVTFAAVLFTLLLAAVQRRRELGLLAAVGMSPRGLASMVLMEAGVVGVVGTIVGTVYGLATIEGFKSVGAFFIPFQYHFAVNMSAPIVYGLIATALLLAGAALPAWRNSRLQVVDAIRYE